MLFENEGAEKRLKPKKWNFPIGLRTLKTAVAVIISMVIVNAFGTTDSRLIFAMLGAMSAVQPTFRESVEASLTQIVGVAFGVAVSVLLLLLPWHPLVLTGIGIILVISLYHFFCISFSPSLPCLLLVMLCTDTTISPVWHGLGRIWDTAIGLGVGMLINMLVFPYDNSLRIRRTAESLDKELLHFLEELFDGDDVIPNSERMTKKIGELEKQLQIFEKQKLFLRLQTQHKELKKFHRYERKARALLAQMVVLSSMEKPGCLNMENRKKLVETGAQIRDTRAFEKPSELDVVTNYHVAQILTIREELLEILK